METKTTVIGCLFVIILAVVLESLFAWGLMFVWNALFVKWWGWPLVDWWAAVGLLFILSLVGMVFRSRKA